MFMFRVSLSLGPVRKTKANRERVPIMGPLQALRCSGVPVKRERRLLGQRFCFVQYVAWFGVFLVCLSGSVVQKPGSTSLLLLPEI